MNIYFDDSPTKTGHNHRGIGVYTRQLKKHLHKTNCIFVKKAHTADIVHYPFFDLFFSTLPLWVLLKSIFFNGPKVVVTIHDVIPLLFPDRYPVGIRGKGVFWFQKYKLKYVSQVITDSHVSKRDIAKYLSYPLEKISVVPLASGLDVQTVSKKDTQKTLTAFGLKARTYILYVGDINYNKNIPRLIRAMKYLPKDISLVCVGKNFFHQHIPEWDSIAQAVKEVESNRVIFIPTIKVHATTVLTTLYQEALAYVQPSLYEGFGLPVLEAMQCKTPVVSANTGSLPEVVGNHGILVSPTDRDIAKGIQKIMHLSSREHTLLVESAFQWAHSFSWQKTAQETYKIYQKVFQNAYST